MRKGKEDLKRHRVTITFPDEYDDIYQEIQSLPISKRSQYVLDKIKDNTNTNSNDTDISKILARMDKIEADFMLKLNLLMEAITDHDSVFEDYMHDSKNNNKEDTIGTTDDVDDELLDMF